MRFTKIILSILAFILMTVAITLTAQAAEKTEIKVQLGHPSDVTSVAFSPDGRYALSGSVDKTLKLWEVSSGKVVRTFSGHSNSVNSVAFSPDGKYALSGSVDKTLKLWEVASGKVVRTFAGHSDEVNSVAFSPDGKYLLSGSSDKTLKLWEIASGKELRTFTGHSNSVNSVTFSPDVKYVLSGSRDKTLKLWEVASGKEIRTFTGHSDTVTSVAFSPDGKYILSGSGDKTLKLWEISSGKEIRTFSGHSDWVNSVAFSPDGKYALSGSGSFQFKDNTLKLWEISSGKEVRTFSGHSSTVNSVAFSPDGRYALSGSFETLKLWEVSSGRELRTFTGHSERILSVVFSPDGRYALSGSLDDTLKLWEVTSGKEVRTFTGHSSTVNSVAFSSDGKYVLSGSLDDTLKLWEVVSGREIRTFSGHSDEVNSVAFSPDGKYALSGSDDKTLKLWEISSGRELRTFTGHSKPVTSVAFSPDGRYALSGSEDMTLKLWKIASGQEIRTFTGHSDDIYITSVAFSPDGRYALSGSWDTLELWEVASGKEIRIFENTDAISSVAFSLDGRYALSGSYENILKLWEVASGKEIRTFIGHFDHVNSVAFSPDGRYALSGSRDSTTRLWDIATGKELLQYIGMDNGEWVTMTPDGYFNASPNGAQYINVVQGMNVYSIDNFFETYYRPDIVTARIQGRDTSALATADLTQGIKLPPQVTLGIKTKDGSYRELTVTPTADYLVENGNIKVRVTAKDIGGGIKGVRLFNNGKVVGENLRGIKIQATVKDNLLTQEFEVALSDGANILKAVGFALDMTESNPVTAEVTYRAPGTAKPDMYVLAIGINEYKNSKYNLNYCVPDAQGFIETLKPKAEKIFGKVAVITLLNKDATRANVLQALEKIKSQAGPKDVFTFFYAGHGVALDVNGDGGGMGNEFFYVLTDVTQMSDPSREAVEGLSGTEMRKQLAEIKAGKQIMFVDACNSGAFANQFTVRGAAEENALAKLSRATGSVILASTTSEQSAIEFTALKHGAFTYVVIEALTGKAALANGQITAAGLKAYIDDQIPELTRKYRGDAQYPTTFLWGNDFPIGIN
jgi:WD40 repeat protein